MKFYCDVKQNETTVSSMCKILHTIAIILLKNVSHFILGSIEESNQFLKSCRKITSSNFTFLLEKGGNVKDEMP